MCIHTSTIEYNTPIDTDTDTHTNVCMHARMHAHTDTRTQTHAHTDAPPHLQLALYHSDHHHSLGHCLTEAVLLAH